MEQFVVSARKYRPATFSDVVGQETVTGTLLNAIKNHQLSHAYLFCGPRGVGKTTCARILAKVINEEEGVTSPDTDFSFNIFELDAASNNSVEDIRSLIDQVRIPPQTGKYKVYIIDEVHMLSAAAFNAFLKTLEEPPEHAIFILATTEKHKILPTILSRCQIYDFNRISADDMVDHLKSIAAKENVEVEEEALYLIAQKADGALRDALTLFDQMIVFGDGKILYESVVKNLHVLDHETNDSLVTLFLESNISGALLKFNELLSKGYDGLQILTSVGEYLRNVLLSKDPSTAHLLDMSENAKARLAAQAQNISEQFILDALDIIRQTDISYRTSKNQKLAAEIAIMQLCSVQKLLQNHDAQKKKHLILATIRTKGSIIGKQITPSTPPTPVKNNQESAEVKPEQTAPVKPEKSPVEAREVKTVEVNESILRGETVSIAALRRERLKKKDEQAASGNENETNTMNEHVSRETFMDVWKSLCDQLKEEGKMSLYSTFTRRDPELQDDLKILLTIDNQAQVEELNENSSEIHEFIRTQLKNSNLLIETVINENPEDKRAYTSAEKFEQLKEKFPDVQKLKDDLDLDINI